jgi:WD40 repeat protein
MCYLASSSDYLISPSSRELRGCVRQIAFSPDGNVMIAVGDGGIVSIYNLISEEQKQLTPKNSK